MSFSPEEIRRLQEVAPGWEEVWAKLCRALLGDDGRSGRLVQAAARLRLWRQDEDRDDFVAYTMLRYQERAGRGALLAGYDPACGSPEDYLTSYRTLRGRALDFLRKARRQTEGPAPPRRKEAPSLHREHVGEEQLENQPQKTARIGREPRLLIQVQEHLERVLAGPGHHISRPVEQAGLQLFPRLDWSLSCLDRLRQHLAAKLQPPPEHADPFAYLAEVHAREQEHLAAEADDIARRTFCDGQGASVKDREHLENLRIDNDFHRAMMPLRALAVMQLLGITKHAANMAFDKYRELLRSLQSPGSDEEHQL